MKDKQVHHPSHYNIGKIEVIEAIVDWKLGFSLGCVVKYVARAGHKHAGNEITDLEKAAWYLDDHIERLKKAQGRKPRGKTARRPDRVVAGSAPTQGE